jgi:hypothetical protein
MLRGARTRTVVALLAAMGLLGAVAAALSGQAGAASTGTAATASTSDFSPVTPQAVAFHDQMRKLWEDHVTWTRLAIVSAVGGKNGQALPDTGVTVDRLQRNQDDIGAAIVPYFGQAAGNQLATLLHAHIDGAVRLLLAAKAGDTAEVDAAKTDWYANGQQIADFLSAANPKYWPDDTMREEMQTHLDQTLQEAVDQIQHNVDGVPNNEVSDYEAAHQHILMMADLLSAGILQQFRNQFAQ